MKAFDLLIIGGSGFVGSKVVKLALSAGLRTAYTYSRNQLAYPAASFHLQIQEDKALETCIAETKPRCIIYCAVPMSSSDENVHDVVSVQGIKRVCAALRNLGNCKLIYISTNAVFSGQDGPYKEGDMPDPEKRHDQYRVYAMTRAQGEQVALNSWHNTIIARTSDVNGKDWAGALNARLANLVTQLKAGNEMERSANALISPTLVDNLAEGLLEISGHNFVYHGILHLAGCEQISYFDFACRVAEKIKANKALIKPEFTRIWNISLDTCFTQSLIQTPLLHVEDQLAAIFS